MHTSRRASVAISALLFLVAIVASASLSMFMKLQNAKREISDLQSAKANNEKKIVEMVQYHLRQAERFEALSKSKISSSQEAESGRKKLIYAISKHGLYSDDGPRIANSILGRLKRLSQFYKDDFNLEITDKMGNVEIPLQAIQAMKSILAEICKRTTDPECLIGGLSIWRRGSYIHYKT